MKIKIGQQAPLFESRSQDGNLVSLSSLKGKFVILYFYPKDLTPGCTIEAQDFSKFSAEFEKRGALILGVSRDSAASHCKFIEKHELKIDLLCDEEGELCESYGVLQKKSMFGKSYIGIDRSTFLISKTGKILETWQSVKVNGHVEEVLSAIDKHMSK